MPMITRCARIDPRVANLAPGAPWHWSDKAVEGMNMSESIGARPPYLLLVDELRARIDAGELPPGAQLPSTQMLMDEFKMSSQPVQRAIRVLKTEGLVEAIPGKGVFVRERGELATRALSAWPAADGGEEPLHRGVPVVTDLRDVVPPVDVAAALGLPDGQPAFLRRTTWTLHREPVEIVASYYPLAVARGTALAEAAALPDDSTSVLISLGYEVRRAEEVVHARMPTPEEARVLKVSAGTAVFRVVRTVHDADGNAVEVTDTVLAGDRYQLRYELPIHA